MDQHFEDLETCYFNIRNDTFTGNTGATIKVSTQLEMTSAARQKRGNSRYAITYVIWANQKTKSFEYHWLRTLAMFDVTSFPAILSGIPCHFKLCRYVNYFMVWDIQICLHLCQQYTL